MSRLEWRNRSRGCLIVIARSGAVKQSRSSKGETASLRSQRLRLSPADAYRMAAVDISKGMAKNARLLRLLLTQGLSKL